jgi:hypothetical protein
VNGRLLQPFLTLVLALACACLAPAAAADPYVHPPTRLVFPDEIAGLQRGDVQDYEAKHAGLGVSVRYERPREIRADVYLYTAGLAQVPADVDHPIMVKLRQQTDREIVSFQKGKGVEARRVESRTLAVDTARGAVPVYFDAYEIGYPAGLASYVWLWSARNHIVKIRLTRAGGEPEPRTVREFAGAVVRLTQE